MIGLVAVAAMLWAVPGMLHAEDATSESGSRVADNSRCFVCHINYKREELASRHARANVGCAKCHGDSSAHCGDEDNVTPPDIMFPKERINPSCLECHPAAKLSDVHKSALAGTDPKMKHCTDCHGKHRLEYRVQHWDKATGKLLAE